MSKENRKLLADALRSGKYKQGKTYLHRDDEFCCLGVGCEVYQEQVGGLRIENDMDRPDASVHTVVNYEDCSAYMPPIVAAWYGFDHAGSFVEPIQSEKGELTNLTHCNDAAKLPFDQIADLIETRDFISWPANEIGPLV